MAQTRIGIIVNGATGALATHQHLRALLALRREGGHVLANGGRVMPDLMLVGRNAAKLQQLAAASGIERWSADLDAALASPDDTIFFDAAVTEGRYGRIERAIAAGKHIYVEKPIAGTLADALAIARSADRAGLKHGTVQDKLFLPGFQKLARVRASGFFGRMLEARLEFSRFIFDGSERAVQRPSWNYQKQQGGGLILDMFPHWRYMIDHLVGRISAVSCTTRTQIPRRIDEHGRAYDVDVEDAVFAQFETADGVTVSCNTSWASRVRRDDVLTLQIDGTSGSAMAGPQDCWTQADVDTPSPTLQVDRRQPASFFEQWSVMPDHAPVVNSYRRGWELFLSHVAEDTPFPSPLLAGAEGLQLVELAHQSHRERRWIAVPPLAK